MKLILLFFVLISTFSFAQKTEKSFLYLQNQRTDKIKKINLTSSKFISYSVDVTQDNYNRYLTYDCYSPTTCKFGESEIEFHAEEINYSSWKHEENRDYDDSWNMLKIDSTMTLPYSTSEETDIIFSRQSKAGFVLFRVGCGIVYASLVNAFFVAPMRGLNAGSFNGYSTQRLWRGELYSGIGLSIGVPLMFIFDYKDYYFQNPNGVFDTWVVVEGN